MSDFISIKQALATAYQQLQENHSNNNKLEADILLCHVINKDRSWLFTWPDKEITPAQQTTFTQLIRRRLKGEPISYIIGQQEFWGIPLLVNEHTLIPRPETELLVETALALFDKKQPVNILDLGTGSGAIAIALASERPHWNILATDVDQDTLNMARKNCDKHSPQVTTQLSHWFDNIKMSDFDLIISNPPYIEKNDPHLTQGDLRFEPQHALHSGSDGLNDIRIIIEKSFQFLKHIQGYLLIEHGYDQANRIRNLYKNFKFQDVRTIKDLAGHDRITLGHN